MIRSGALALVALGCVLGCDATLPAAPPHTIARPSGTPAPMQLCWVEYSTNQLPASYGVAGASDHEQWEITYSGLLIRHPKGDVLLDAGNSSRFAEEIGTAGVTSRVLLRLYPGAGDRVASAPQALRAVGQDPARLFAIAISHVHADHVGGAMDIPGVPIVLSQEELDFVRAEKDEGGFDVVRAHAAAIDKRAKPFRFAAVPYENFDLSYDLFGDGAVVFVPLFGHTPGSIGTFVRQSPTQSLFHVGDAVNVTEAIEKRRGKSVIMEVTDRDGDRADAVVSKLAQLRSYDPGVTFLPAHDRSAWERIFGAPGRCTGAAVKAR